VKDVDRIESIKMYATLSRVSFCGIPFTQYHILFHPKKGNSQRDAVLYRITRQLLHHG
jgi:hypothetical protein